MIAIFKSDVTAEKQNQLAEELQGIQLKEYNKDLLILGNSVKSLSEKHESYFQDIHVFNNDMQLSSREYLNQTREISVGDVKIGGNQQNTLLTIGPCSVESEVQIEQTAQLITKYGLKTLRAGSYKPRTSPYSFQGMGLEGLQLLRKTCDKYNLKLVTEVRDASHVNEVIEYSDVVQVGAKSMYSHAILRACAKTQKPILLKRGFGTNLQEFVNASEFILSGGNPNVILCERGIRTFENKTRFTLDLCGASWLKEHSNLPLILDPSHAIGYAFGVPDLARACMALGVEGLLIEVHPNPKVAKSDASQQLDHQQFETLYQSLNPIANAIQRNIV